MPTVPSHSEVKAESYVRRIGLTDAIRQSLNDYPLGSGIIRELIQNSDDAGANTQILVLDRRTFGTSTLYDPVLARYQGPALLAFNDSEFTEQDWESLMTISNSKKKDDVSKAGKFGLGFNAVHHITDAPSVISGQHLAVLDPHEDLARNPGGARLDFPPQADLLGDQLSAFKSLAVDPRSPLEGTIVRLPLRTTEDASRSRIKQEKTSMDDIRSLMDTFIHNELNIALLFLKHLKSIELREVSETGEVIPLASAELLGIAGPRSCPKSDDADTSYSGELKVQWVCNRREETNNWLVRHEIGNVVSIGACLPGASPANVEMLKEEKLYPHIAIALPLSAEVTGRLFTYLPLPIETGFPVHLHALFALTSDRQSLRNSTEKTQSGSRERLLQGWNVHLFQELIPHAWANVLQDAKAHVKDIYSYWPPRSEATDWKRIDVEVFRKIVHNNLAVWPLYATGVLPSTPEFLPLDCGLVDISNTKQRFLKAIAKTKLPVIKPPPHVVSSIKNAKLDAGFSYASLAPITLSQKIKEVGLAAGVEDLSPDEKIVILEYLYDPKACTNLFGIPVVPQINGSFAAIQGTSNDGRFESVSVFWASETEISLFRDLESRFVDRSLIEKVLSSGSTAVLNPSAAFINRTDAVKFSMKHGCHLVNSTLQPKLSVGKAEWLSKVHEWADSCYRQLRYSGAHSDIDQLPLPLVNDRTVPAHSGSPRPPVMQSHDLRQKTIDMFCQLDIPLLHKNFAPTRYLQTMRRISTAFEADAVLRWLENCDTLATLPGIRASLHRHLSEAFPAGSIVPVHLGRVIRNLPVFLAYEPDPSGRPSKLYTSFGEEPVYVLGQSLDIIPDLPRHTLIDLSRESNARLVRLLDPKATPVAELQLAQLAADNLGSQPEYLVDQVFEKLILPHIFNIRRTISFERLKATPFVTTRAGRRAPSFLVDPQADIRGLFSDDDPALPTGLYAQTGVLEQLRGVGFFRGCISCDMVDERVRKYANSHPSPDIIRCAETLLNILDSPTMEVDFPKSIGEVRWIPIHGQLVGANSCRDQSQRHLVSRVLSILPRNLKSPQLRKALGWSADVPNEVLRRQFTQVVDDSHSQDKVESLQKLLPVLHRQLTSEAEIEALRTAAGDRAWIPIRNGLQSVHSVYTSEDVRDLEPSFFRLPDPLRSFFEFFVQMGVPALPLPDNLVQELHLLAASPPKTQHLDRCVTLLEAISMMELSEALQPSILVPNTAGKLCSIADVIFDDRGRSQSDLNPLDNYVHSRVSLHLAKQLRIPKASSRLIDALAEDDAFGHYEQYETMQSKIRKTLLSYSYLSTCNEILANADDAGATDVCIMYDKRRFSETGALFSGLQDIHSGPALVFHNNSVFTPDDWEGLINVGTGGKSGKDSIGRFGLGALTFFHWTDVPLLVSGNYAVFLDPSGEYLPRTEGGHPRMGVKFSLGRFDDGRFDGTFQPLVGLFDFQLREYYNGTLIRLPLRQAGSKLLENYETPNMDMFLKQCEDDANMAFLFTRCLKGITVRKKEHDGSCSNILCITGARGNGPEIPAPDYPGTLGDITSSEVTVTSMPANVKQRFLVMKSTIPADSLPLDPPIRQCAKKHRLSTPSIGLAYLMRANLAVKREKMRLMSTFSLGVTELPVHLHGEFILSTDRKSIILDKIASTSPETQYNEFLLSKLGPPLYLYLIHVCLMEGYPTNVLWPSLERSTTEKLVEEMYKLLPEFPGVLFKTTPTSICPGAYPVAPRDALFNAAPQLTSFLRQIGVPNLVTTSNRLLSHELVPTLHFDDAAWMAAFLKDKGDELQRLFKDNLFSKGLLQELISLIISALGPQGLHGLCLCPTTTLHAFQFNGDSEAILVPSSMEDTLFSFSKHRFLNREYLGTEVVDKLLAAEAGLNVRKFNPTTDVCTVMEQAFPASPGPVHVSNMKTRINDRAWLSTLRDYIVKEKVPVDNLRSLPFISLSHPEECYISADSSSSLFAVDRLWTGFSLLEAIKQLEGFHIIARWSDLPPELTPEPKAFQLSQLLRWLQSDTHVDSWYSLDHATQSTLTSFIRERLQSENVTSQLTSSSPLAQIPLWECHRPNGDISLQAAVHVVVLPSPMSATVMARYLTRDKHFTSLPKGLREVVNALGARILSRAEDLTPFLRLPERLEMSDVPSFREFLFTLLRHPDETRRLRIAPDGSLNLCLPSVLFHPEPRPTVDVFRRSLYPSQLLHADFMDMADAFRACGLRAGLDFPNLEECARAVDRAVNDPSVNNVRERAESVYEALSLITIQEYEYRRLESFAFIPRQSDDLSPLWRRPHLPPSSDVVSPVKLLLQEHTSIAWTQRSRFATEPAPALCTRWPRLGRPRVEEVVQHLVMLSTVIAGADLENTYAWGNDFVEDLRQTYDHLQRADSEEVHQALQAHSTTPIFLNIENSQSHPWVWASTDSLILDIDDDNPASGLAHVRKFLAPYTALLLTAGVQRITPPDVEAFEVADDSAYPEHLLKGVGGLLDDESLTDIALAAKNQEGTLRAHKLVLAATSEWFRDRFCGGYQDDETVELDVSFVTLQAIVDYFYGRNPIPDWDPTDREQEVEYIDTLLELLIAADKYMVTELKKIAERHVLQGGRFIRLDTARDILEHARHANSDDVVRVCAKFIEANAALM